MGPLNALATPNGNTGKTMSFVALAISIAVGVGTLIYLHHQIKISKIKLAEHEKDTTAHKKNPA
jgi:uncharacterized protein HemX